MATGISISDLYTRIKRLGLAGTFLHLGAHPDDEDIGLLTYLSFKHKVNAVYWSATRGEGGQNRVNSYAGKALGVYRTWESQAVRDISGGRCLFGPFIDFGYSKNAEESFSRWGRENMVREQVRAIRLVQPQVVVCRWTGGAGDLHGHHQAVGEAMSDAFNAAGDPKAFPELVDQGLPPWQPVKLYCSLDNGTPDMPGSAVGNVLGRPNPILEKEGIIRINSGEYDPLRGRTFQETAWEGYNRHQSQAIGLLPVPGDFYYYFKLLQSRVPVPDRETDMFDGLDAALTGLFSGAGDYPTEMEDSLAEVKALVDEAEEYFHGRDQKAAAGPLLRGKALLEALGRKLPSQSLGKHVEAAMSRALHMKIREFEDVSARCLGLRLETICTRKKVTPGESFWMSSHVWNQRDLPMGKTSFQVRVPEHWRVEEAEDFNSQDERGHAIARYEVFIGKRAHLSCPSWLWRPGTPHLYDVSGNTDSDGPEDSSAVEATCRVEVDGHSLSLYSRGLHRMAFAGGYQEIPPAVVPPISLHPETGKLFLPASEADRHLELEVVARCNDDERPAEGRLRLIGPKDWPISPPEVKVDLAQGGGARSYTFSVAVPRTIAQGDYNLHYEIQCRGRRYGVIMTPVRMGAPGLPDADDADTCIKEEMILEPAGVVVHLIDVKSLTGARYAYIAGVKEDSLAAVAGLGLDFEELSDHQIEHRDLKEFDAIVVGPKAYNLREALSANAHRLLDYVDKGGALIVQYQWYGYEHSGLAPFPFKYNQPMDRVTDENAPVEFLCKQDGIFHFPNRITPQDFAGWSHDRGLAFWGEWDSRYKAYLSCSDPGEENLTGGLVGCRYGQGFYYYVGYSLFRQLPLGVPGAFRLLSNLLAAGHGVKP